MSFIIDSKIFQNIYYFYQYTQFQLSLCLVLLTNLINRLFFVYKVLKITIDVSGISFKSSFRKIGITNLYKDKFFVNTKNLSLQRLVQSQNFEYSFNNKTVIESILSSYKFKSYDLSCVVVKKWRKYQSSRFICFDNLVFYQLN